MKHNYINQLGGGIYAAPEIEIYEMPAENGFGGSGFGEEGGTGNVNYGEDNDLDI